MHPFIQQIFLRAAKASHFQAQGGCVSEQNKNLYPYVAFIIEGEKDKRKIQ